MPRHAITNLTSPRECAAVLRAMGDETRLRILESLLLGEKCVTDLTQVLRCSQPHVSHHLRILREAGLVEGHRHGKQVCYRVVPTVQRALKNRSERMLNFGCCELRFPTSTLLTVPQKH